MAFDAHVLSLPNDCHNHLSSSVAVVTNHHKCSGLKTQTEYLTYLQMASIGFAGPKPRCCQGPIPSRGSKGKSISCFFFSASRGHPPSMASGHHLLPSSMPAGSALSSFSDPTLLLLSFNFKDPCDDTGFTQIIQNDYLVLWSIDSKP